MHRPGALEAATLASYAALALVSALVSRRRPELRPQSASLALLAAVDVARLWTRDGPLDVVLFVAWPFFSAAPTLPVLGLRRARWANLGGLVAGGAVVLAGGLLGTVWTEVLRGSRVAATALAAVMLADRFLRTRARLSLPEVAALVLPASTLADLVAVWTLPEPARSFWVARVGSLATNAFLGGILVACSRRRETPSPP